MAILKVKEEELIENYQEKIKNDFKGSNGNLDDVKKIIIENKEKYKNSLVEIIPLLFNDTPVKISLFSELKKLLISKILLIESKLKKLGEDISHDFQIILIEIRNKIATHKYEDISWDIFTTFDNWMEKIINK